jgi:hypothetical protein
VSTPTLLGTLVGISAVVIGVATGSWWVASIVLSVAIIGWIAFAVRDMVKRRRAT